MRDVGAKLVFALVAIAHWSDLSKQSGDRYKGEDKLSPYIDFRKTDLAMKLQLLTTLLLSASIACAAPVTIAGIARDGSHKNALLPGATVQLLASGDGDKRSVIDTTTTDAQGRF